NRRNARSPLAASCRRTDSARNAVESKIPHAQLQLFTSAAPLLTATRDFGISTVATVYLIGAGPGDPGLITVRGRECLESAGVVLYDHLVPARVLRYARADAEKIDVGEASTQPVEHEAICYLLAEKAREGKVVARLKWGDPFMFDYGGAEALFLHEQGIGFDVVPGVPAAVAGPTYAGVPITYPRARHTLTFVPRHDDESGTPT